MANLIARRGTIGKGGPTTYLVSWFAGNTTAEEQGYLSFSNSGQSPPNAFTPWNNTTAGLIFTNADSVVGTVRASEFFAFNSKLYCTYQLSTTISGSTALGISVSTNGGYSWTQMSDISFVGSIGSLAQVWPGQILIDTTGTVHIFASCDISVNSGSAQVYEVHNTAGDLSAWSSPVLASTGISSNISEMMVIQLGTSSYACFASTQGAGGSAYHVDYYTASSYLGSWTLQQGSIWGSSIESASVYQIPGGSWRAVTQFFGGGTQYYATSPNPFTASSWSALTSFGYPQIGIGGGALTQNLRFRPCTDATVLPQVLHPAATFTVGTGHTWTCTGLSAKDPAMAAAAFSGSALITHTAAAGSSLAAGINTTGATSIVVAVSAGAAATGVSDNKGNVYVALNHAQNATSLGEIQLWVAYLPGLFVDINEAVGGAQPGSATAVQNGELIITAADYFPGHPVSVNEGFTITDQVNEVASVNYGVALAYLFQTTATTLNPTWTGTSLAAATAIASFA